MITRCPAGKQGFPGNDGNNGLPGTPGPVGPPGASGVTTLPQIVTSFIPGTAAGTIITNNFTFPFSVQNSLTPDPTWATFNSINFSYTLQPGTYLITIYIEMQVTAGSVGPETLPAGSQLVLVDFNTNIVTGIPFNCGPVTSSNPLRTYIVNPLYKFPLTVQTSQTLVVRFLTSNTNNNLVILGGPSPDSIRGIWTLEKINSS